MVYKESLYYLLYSCTNPIFVENLVPEIYAKMLLANEIAEFLNQLYLQNKIMKKADFFAFWYKLIEIKSWLKYIGRGQVQKWVWPLWSQDFKNLYLKKELME